MKLATHMGLILLSSGLVITLGLAEPVRAQSVQAGVVGGVAISNLIGDDAGSSESRTGLVGGAQLVFKPESFVGFQTGLLYSSRGASFSEAGVEGFLKLGYVEIPLLLRLSPLPAGSSSIRFHVLAGASLGIRVNCSAGISGGGVSIEAECGDDEVEGDEIKSTDLGLSLGMGFDMPAGSRLIITPGARYVRGLFRIADSPENDDVKNTSFELGVALRLRPAQ